MKKIMKRYFIVIIAPLVLAACNVKDPIYENDGLTIATPTDNVPWTDAQALPKGYDLTIGNEEQLRAFAAAVNAGGQINGKPAAEAWVLQTADIELTKEWVPIGNSVTNMFRGVYNGDGHTITGLTIKTVTPDTYSYAYAGLFSGAEEAVLTGIHLRKVEIDIPEGSGETYLYVGSIAGHIENSTLSLCSATGKVKASNGTRYIYAGGIAGFSTGSTISRCRAGVETKATTTHTRGEVYTGEIAGENFWHSFILSCEAQGMPVAAEGGQTARAGGITGLNQSSGLIAFCRTGANTVTAQNAANISRAGGLVGDNSGFLYSCYSRATAEATGGGNNHKGAIVGNNNTPDRVKHCYATGTTGPGTSNLDAVTRNIVYNTFPDNSDISNVMKGYTDMVVSTTFKGETAYPAATLYNSTATPAHGIEPLRMKWSRAAWQNGINTTYPEINMEYGGE